MMTFLVVDDDDHFLINQCLLDCQVPPYTVQYVERERETDSVVVSLSCHVMSSISPPLIIIISSSTCIASD